MANITSPFGGGGSGGDSGDSGTSDVDDSQDTLRDIRDEQRRRQRDTRTDTGTDTGSEPVDTRDAAEEIRDVRDQQREQQSSGTDSGGSPVSERRTQNLDNLTEQTESDGTSRLSDAPAGTRRAIRQTEQAGFGDEASQTYDTVTSDRFQRNVRGSVEQAEAMSTGADVSSSPLNIDRRRRGPRGRVYSERSGQSTASVYSDVVEPTGLFLGDLFLEGEGSPQVTNVDERLRREGRFLSDVVIGGRNDSVRLSGPELSASGTFDQAKRTAITMTPGGVGYRLLQTSGVGDAATAANLVLQGRDEEAEQVLRERVETISEQADRVVSSPIDEGLGAVTDVFTGGDDAPPVYVDEDPGEPINEGVVRSLTQGDGIIDEGTRELKPPSQQLTNPIEGDVSELSDSDIRDQVAEANVGVDPDDVTVSRDTETVGGRQRTTVRFGVDLDEEDVRERVAAENPGVDPGDVMFREGDDGPEFVVREGGDGVFDVTEAELRQRLQTRQEKYGFGEEAEDVVAGLTGSEKLGRVAFGVGEGFGMIAGTPEEALLTVDKATEVAPNVPGTVEEFGGRETAVTTLELGGRTTSAAFEAAEEDPYRIAGIGAVSFATGAAAGKVVGSVGRFARDRIRTAGGRKVDLEDITSEEVVTNLKTGGADGDDFPGAENPDLYRSNPAEAVRQQASARTPDDIVELFEERGVTEGVVMKKGLDVEPEGPGSFTRGSRGFESTPDEVPTVSDPTPEFAYENPGAFFSPDFSAYFLRSGARSRFSMRPGLPSFGSRPTGVFAKTDVEAPTARTQAEFVDELRERAGDTTMRTKPAGSSQLNTGEIEAVAPPGARYSDIGGTRGRNALRRLGIGADAYTEVPTPRSLRIPGGGELDLPGDRSVNVPGGRDIQLPFGKEFDLPGGRTFQVPGGRRRVPFRLVKPDTDDIDSPTTIDVDGDELVPAFSGKSLSSIGRYGTPDVDRPTPVVPSGTGSDSTSSRGSDLDGSYSYVTPVGSGGSGGGSSGGSERDVGSFLSSVAGGSSGSGGSSGGGGSAGSGGGSGGSGGSSTSFGGGSSGGGGSPGGASRTLPFFGGGSTPAPPADVPDIGIDQDEDEEFIEPFGVRDEEFTDFIDPLTGEVLETETTL